MIAGSTFIKLLLWGLVFWIALIVGALNAGEALRLW